MPVGKYYCDYCDKQFQETAFARKRHIQGVQHQRAKKLWYDSLRDPNQIHPQPFGIGVCNRFVRTGSCQYGDSCKYYHPKQNLEILNTQGQGVAVTSYVGNSQSSSDSGSHVLNGASLPGNISQGDSCDTYSFIFTFGSVFKILTLFTMITGEMVRDNMGISLGNLPPSLKPPPEGGYPQLPFVDWG
ncbi:hypothetical protein RJ639_006560 [Escallonia herrerae]|uniref:C3H1-type domain-containing protein n=1 Tax=Escallonia herrerae TaxID=1293975 RepID=A0AA89AU57_9ASTE|nr:hypothetical protein RJ639_006560 [Escallonia herrerae]